ncbi:hypothetical protein KKG58_04110 [Patescibacteria group bacterium]|nr:hypothetical protein [Patescibacteria group bacterium]
MANEKLISYIKENLALGKTQEQIKKTLIETGWQEIDIKEAFSFLGLVTPDIKEKESSQITENRIPTKVSQRPVAEMESSEENVPAQELIAKTKSSKKALYIGLNIVIILAVAVIGFFYFLKPSSAKVMAAMATKMSVLKTFHFNLDLEIRGKIPVMESNEFFEAKVHGEGDIDQSDLENPTYIIDSKMSVQGDKDIVFDFEGTEKRVDGISYVKYDVLPLPLREFGLDEVKNQWVRFESESQEEQKLEGEMISPTEFSSQEQDLLIDLFQGASLFKTVKVLEKEEVDGILTFHYQVDIDKKDISSCFKSLVSSGLIDEEDFADLVETKIEFWIGKEDYFLRRIFIYLELRDIEDKQATLSLTLNATISKHNQSLEIKAPQNTKNFEEILENLFTNMIDGMADQILGKPDDDAFENNILGDFSQDFRAGDRDKRRISDIKMIQSGLDVYYQENNKFPESETNNLSETNCLTNKGFENNCLDASLFDSKIYMSFVPQAPEPADGDCDKEKNKYSYQRISPKEYRLSFCLGKETYDFSAGVNTISVDLYKSE